MKAFPVTKFNSHRAGHDGMDLRDYFAAKAMQGMLRENNQHITVAEEAYKIADAMLEQRQR